MLSIQDIAVTGISRGDTVIGNVPTSGGKMATLTGQTLGGYLILEELGRGAMGVVFKARQLSVDRFVAIKFLPQRLAQNEKIVARFLREARAAGQLSHPNIVNVHDVGVVEGLNYIAMEFVDGTTAHKRVQEKGPYTEKETLEIAGQVADALKCAHTRGILHRDIKPDNFLIDSAGRVRLADLGLARIVTEGSSKDAELTQDGTTMGTPHYMSPEQCKGLSVDHRTDLYSLGASMYVMATGKTPYAANSAAGIMVKVISEPPRPLREAGPHLSASFLSVVERLMAKDQAKRFQNAQELLDVLAQCKTGEYRPVTAKQSKVVRLFTARPAGAAAASSPLRPLLYGAGCALAVIVLLVAMSKGQDQANPPGDHKPPDVAQNTARTDVPPPATPSIPPAVTPSNPPSPDNPVAAADARKEQESGRRFGEFMRELGPLAQRDPGAAAQRLEEFLKQPLPARAAERARVRLEELRAARDDLAKEWLALQPVVRKEFDEGRRGEALQMLTKFAQAHEGSKEAGEAHKALATLADETHRDAEKLADAGKLKRAHDMLNTAIQKLPEDLTATLKKDLEEVAARQQALVALIEADNTELAELHRKAAAFARDPDGKTNKPYRFGDAAQVYRDGQSRLKTAEVKKDAEAVREVYARAADVFSRMEARVNDKRQKVHLPRLGTFKDAGQVSDWTGSGLTYIPRGLPPQPVSWRQVTPDDLLEIARSVKIGVGDTPADAFDLGALAFAAGAESTARQKLTEVAGSESPFKTPAEEALQLLKPGALSLHLTGREATAKQLYDETLAAKEKNSMDVVRKNVTRLVSEFSDTQFVKERLDSFSRLLIPGAGPKPDAPKTADQPKEREAEPEKPEDKEAAKAELKKLGWTEVTGEWTQDPKRKTAFSVKGGGVLACKGDKEVRVSFQLEEGATIGIFLRYETDQIRNLRNFIQLFLGKNRTLGPGYGISVQTGDATVYGAEKFAGRGGKDGWAPFETSTLKLAPAASHTVIVICKDNSMDIGVDPDRPDGRAFHYNEKLRPEGDTRIIIGGNAKIDSPSFK